MLFDTEWWISVVVAGFLVGLASAYAKSGIDYTLGLFSKTVRVRLNRSKQRFNEQVEFLLANPVEVVRVQINKMYHAMICFMSVIITLVFLMSAEVAAQHRGVTYLEVYGILILIVPLSTFVGYIYHLLAFLRVKDVLIELDKRKKTP